MSEAAYDHAACLPVAIRHYALILAENLSTLARLVGLIFWEARLILSRRFCHHPIIIELNALSGS